MELSSQDLSGHENGFEMELPQHIELFMLRLFRVQIQIQQKVNYAHEIDFLLVSCSCKNYEVYYCFIDDYIWPQNA